MKIQCPKCKSKYSAKLDSIPEKGQKLECATCNHVFLVRKKQGSIDRTLAALKDQFSSWDSKMASVEEDQFTKDLLNGEAGHGFTETSSEDLNRFLEEADMAEKFPEALGTGLSMPGTENGTLKNLADELSSQRTEKFPEVSDAMFDDLFEEVESRDLIEQGPDGILDEKSGLEEEPGSGVSGIQEPPEEDLDNLFDVLMEESGEAPPKKSMAAAAIEDMASGLEDLFDDIPTAENVIEPVAAEGKGVLSGEKAEGAAGDTGEAPFIMESSALKDLDSAFDEMFGEDVGAVVSKPSQQLEPAPGGMDGLEGLSDLVQDLSTAEPAEGDFSSLDDLFEEPAPARESGQGGDLIDQLMEESGTGTADEDADTKMLQTPPPPGTTAPDAEPKYQSEEDLWSEALEEQASTEKPQAGQGESEEDLWAAALNEQKAAAAQPGEDEKTKAAVSAISSTHEDETTAVGGISQSDLDQLFSQAAGEDSGVQDTGTQPTKPQGQTEIISQDELDKLWGAAVTEQSGPGEVKEGAGPTGEVEDLWNAALQEQAGGGQQEEARKPSGGGVISQEELDGLFAKATEGGAAEPEKEEPAEDLTSQTEVFAAGEEKTELIADGAVQEKEEAAHGEHGEFEIDDELLAGKKSFKEKLAGLLAFKFLPAEGKKRYAVLGAMLLSLVGVLGGGGYFAYNHFTGLKTAIKEADKPDMEARAKKEERRAERAAKEIPAETPSQPEEHAKETPATPVSPQAPSTPQPEQTTPQAPIGEKNTLEVGLILPIQFSPMETKVLQADFVFEMRDHKAYEQLKFYLPIFQDLMEKITNEFLSQDFYNEIHYAKEKLKDRLMENFNERMKGDWVKNVFVKNFVIDIKKKEEADKKKEAAAKHGEEEKHEERKDEGTKHEEKKH
ncbi:MAG: zinc-ribbon domain-containing protein [Nitrospinae bacterium]|nr:zinc-ribbon domain-containing protein [Nitrospinota bacterium]